MMQLPPYIERPNEDLISKCRRIRAEIRAAAAAQPRAVPYVNDNEAPDGRHFWWERD